MTKRQRKDPETRRNELIAAAGEVFARKGVTNTAVSDIVRQAGVAQGTFYLYFETKQDVMNAFVDQMIESLVGGLEVRLSESPLNAVDRMHALFNAFLAIAEDDSVQEMSDFYHRPENLAVHEQMERRIMPKLVPIVVSIIEQGAEEGVFRVEDPELAAMFLLGGINSIDTSTTDRSEIILKVRRAVDLALRSLGYESETLRG